MTRQEQQQTAHDREAVLRAQRTELEADLTQIVALIESEVVEGAERRSAVESLGQKVEHGTEDDEARMAWYLAAYEDAQHAVVVTHSLMERYNEIARALTSCQQEIMQLPREHRRG